MIDVDRMTPVEIQQAGLSALAKELGPVGFIRFMQQYVLGKGNYTVDRHRWLDALTVDDVLTLAQAEQERANRHRTTA